ncbi:MAG: hypothetical protein M1814_003508 [Vezdaea aestivalis]|nr:MAG: hypothetical protein M1814_003508 [Vezdaea aestivalis]
MSVEWGTLRDFVLGQKQKRVDTESQEQSTPVKSEWDRNFRIKNIPKGLDKQHLAQILSDVLNLDDTQAIKIHSLATDATEDADLEKKVATVSFRAIPELLSSSSAESKASLKRGKRFDFGPGIGSDTGRQIYFDTSFYGFTPLSAAENDHLHTIEYNPITQIKAPLANQPSCIVIHGWGGHPFGSFKAPRHLGTSYMWIRDSLSKHFPALRLWLYGYESELEDQESVEDVYDYAENFRGALRRLRKRTKSSQKSTPIIFMVHSLGGWVLRDALVQMAKSDNEDDRLNFQQTYGGLFFGVPNHGMETASIAAMVGDLPARYILAQLDRRSGFWLRKRQHDEFCTALHYKDSKIVSFFETKKSPTVCQDVHSGEWSRTGSLELLVTPESARCGRSWETGDGYIHPLNGNHSDMVKFAENDDQYDKVREVLQDFTSRACVTIGTRIRNNVNEKIGLKLLHTSQNAIIDIIAIHGLNGHYKDTWTTSDGKILWLQSLLPIVVSNATIWTWGYDSQTHTHSHGNHPTTQTLQNHAQELVYDINSERRSSNTYKRPIIFIAHSLGGLLLKAALLHASSLKKSSLEEGVFVKLSTYGIVFLGTPHQGGQGVDAATIILDVENISSNTNESLLEHPTERLEFLQEQNDSFKAIAQDFELVSAYEMLPTPLIGNTVAKVVSMIFFYRNAESDFMNQIVPSWSTVIPYRSDIMTFGINKDHLNMTRFSRQEDPDFKKVSRAIANMATKALSQVKKNWEKEEQVAQGIGLPITAKFVARELAMQTLERQILPTIPAEERTVSILHGLGGIGKTQLSLAFARKHQGKFSAIFWLNGQTLGHLKRSIAQNVKLLPVGHVSDSVRDLSLQSEEHLDQAVDEFLGWLSRKGNTRWLMIYDNVDRDGSSETEDSDAFPPFDYMPDADHGSVIITTRLFKFRELGEELPVGRMNAKEAEELILNKFNGLANDYTHMETLIERLNGLPLALAQAASFMRQTNSSISKYLQLYNNTWNDLQAKEARLEFLRREYGGRSIHTTWSVSFDHLQKTDQAAAKMLQLWSYLDNREIRYDLFANEESLNSDIYKTLPDWFRGIVSNELDFKQTMATLLDYSLIEAKERLDAYAVHPVVHEWCYNSVDLESHRAFMSLAAITIGSAVPSVARKDYATTQSRLLPHAYRWSSLSSNEVSRKLGPDNSTELLASFNKLGNLYLDQGRLAEAEAMFTRALAGFEKALGQDHTSTLNTVNNLGNLYQKQGRLAEAEAKYTRALAGFEKALGPNHTSTLNTVNNLGNLYQEQGRLAEAEAKYTRALAEFEKAPGPDHTSALKIVNNLGNLYQKQGRLAEAEAMYTRAISGYEKALGRDHTSTLETVYNLGNLFYKNQDRLADAEAMYTRALSGYEKALGRDHTSTLAVILNLGVLCLDQDRQAEADTDAKAEAEVKAEALFTRVLSGYEKALGRDHTSTLDMVYNLGNLFYKNQDRLADAEAMYTRALAGYEKAFGQDHKWTLGTVRNLGYLYEKQGRLAEAETMFKREQVSRSRLNQPPHPPPPP